MHRDVAISNWMSPWHYLNKNFMHNSLIHACHWKSCHNFRCWFLQIHIKMMLFLIDYRFMQAVFQFSKGSILLATSLYKSLLMKNKSKMVKKMSLSGDTSITKGYFVTKFFSVHYLSRPLFWWFFLEDWACSFCVWIN